LATRYLLATSYIVYVVLSRDQSSSQCAFGSAHGSHLFGSILAEGNMVGRDLDYGPAGCLRGQATTLLAGQKLLQAIRWSTICDHCTEVVSIIV